MKVFQKQFWQTISEHPAQLNGVLSNNAKTIAFPGFLYTQKSKYTICPLKTQKMKFLSLLTRRKKFRMPKIWNLFELEPLIVFLQKLDKSGQ